MNWDEKKGLTVNAKLRLLSPLFHLTSAYVPSKARQWSSRVRKCSYNLGIEPGSPRGGLLGTLATLTYCMATRRVEMERVKFLFIHS